MDPAIRFIYLAVLEHGMSIANMPKREITEANFDEWEILVDNRIPVMLKPFLYTPRAWPSKEK